MSRRNTPLCQDSCHFSPREFVLGSGAKDLSIELISLFY
jgi:hypothetical protein